MAEPKKNAGKAPSVQFYWKDFLADMQEHPPEIVGVWVLILIKIWHAKSNGKITRTLTQWSLIMHVTESRAKEYLRYIRDEGIGDVVFAENDNAGITVVNRRTQRDAKLLQQNRLRQQTHRDRHEDNGDVTENNGANNARSNAVVTEKKHPPSTSTSSSSSKRSLKFKKNAILGVLKKDHGTCFRWFMSEFETQNKRDRNTLEIYAKICTVLMEDACFNTWLAETVADIARKQIEYPGKNRMFIKALNNKIEKTNIDQWIAV